MDTQEADAASLLHAYRRFLLWRQSVPALRQGRLALVPLPEPLVGFTRTLEAHCVPGTHETLRVPGMHETQRVLAVFNLSDRPVPPDLAALGRLTVLEESGFADPGGCLGPFGAMFTRIDGDRAI